MLIVGGGGFVTVIVKFCGAVFWPSASCTTTAMGNAPLVAVVPDNTPPVLKAKVAGRFPVSLQLSGASPPLAAKEKLYEFSIKTGSAVTCAWVVVIVGGGGLFTVIVNGTAAEEWPAPSVLVRLNATLPFEVGVPETVPLVGSSERPLAGRPTACQV